MKLRGIAGHCFVVSMVPVLASCPYLDDDDVQQDNDYGKTYVSSSSFEWFSARS